MSLLPGPANIDMYFVDPHVKRGDYYLMINPVTGRRMWVYPRMMRERQFPVISALGSDEVAQEAAAAAEQAHQEAEAIQSQSQSVPLRQPVENAVTLPSAGMANTLLLAGLGFVGALGLAYFLIERGD